MVTALAVRDFEFQKKKVRCVGTDRDPWFVAKDVCEALGMTWKGSESLASIPADWRGVRKLRTPQENQYTRHGAGMTEVIVINEAAVYKLAFRSQKPEADAFTNWVAKEVLPCIRRTGSYTATRRRKALADGKSEEWVEQREEGVETRRGFTDTLKKHGVAGGGYAECTDAINRPVLGGTAALVRIQRNLKPKANLRDHLSTTELLRLQFAESLATGRISKDNLEGNGSCREACRLSGQAVAAAIQLATEGEIEQPAAPASSAVALPPPVTEDQQAELPDTCFTSAMQLRARKPGQRASPQILFVLLLSAAIIAAESHFDGLVGINTSGGTASRQASRDTSIACSTPLPLPVRKCVAGGVVDVGMNSPFARFTRHRVAPLRNMH
jgi:prophage antirepressor-like protein